MSDSRCRSSRSRARRESRVKRSLARVPAIGVECSGSGTLCLHGLAVQSLILGSVHHKAKPPEIQGAGAARTSAPPAEELVLINVAPSSKSEPDLLDQIASLRPHLSPLPIPTATPDLPAIEVASADEAGESASQPSPDAGDPAVRALMFGRYTHQISARVERIWVRPNAPADASESNSTFRCRVQIRQDAAGTVQEVLLVKCPGTPCGDSR